MNNIEKYIEYLYNSTFIPIYLYNENMNLIVCFPNQLKETNPPQKYLKELWKLKDDVSYIETRFFTYYGCIQEKSSGVRIVIGPIHPLQYTNEVLIMMYKDLAIEELKARQFNIFFTTIPNYSLDHFVNIILLINYNVNNAQLNKSDVILIPNSVAPSCIDTKHYEYLISSMEENVFNNDYEIEKELLGYVETGNTKKLKLFFETPACTREHIEVNDEFSLRQKKNMVIIGISLISRSAIKGGLAPSIAYKLADTYFRQAEQLNELNAINSLYVQAIFDYTNRTTKTKIPAGTNKTIYKVVTCVNENIYKNITVADIAEYLQLNQSHLSRMFMNEFGMKLSSYIRQCKLDESKNLLSYSDKPIGEISNLLCFSSQSHFQSAFKKQFGITPQVYRNQVLSY